MDKQVENFWKIRMAAVKNALETNRFEVFLAEKKGTPAKSSLKKLFPNWLPKRFPGAIP
jgi:hypothetical protein